MRIDSWQWVHRRAWMLTLRRLRLLGLGMVALSVLVAPAHLAMAQQVTTVRLAPVAGSGVSGTATIAAREQSATVTVEVSGLAPGRSHAVRLHAGSCAQPSASGGHLGTLIADSGGQAMLTTEQAIASAGGSPIDLTLDLLADGTRSIMVQGPAGPVACSEMVRLAAPARPGLPATGVSGVDMPSGMAPGALTGLGLLLVALGLGSLAGAAARARGR